MRKKSIALAVKDRSVKIVNKKRFVCFQENKVL